MEKLNLKRLRIFVVILSILIILCVFNHKFFINSIVGFIASVFVYFLSMNAYSKKINDATMEDVSKISLYLTFFSPIKIFGYILLFLSLFILLKLDYFHPIGFIIGTFLMMIGAIFNGFF